MKVPIGDTIFTPPTGDGTDISTWSSEPHDGPAVCFSVILRPWVLVRPRESNPRPPALQVKCSTDWASPAMVRQCSQSLHAAEIGVKHSPDGPLGLQTDLKCYCDENSWYPIFLHFRLEYVILSHPAKFQLITTTGSVFFWTVFIEILRPPLLTLVPEAYARISESYVIGSPRTFTWRLAVWK